LCVTISISNFMSATGHLGLWCLRLKKKNEGHNLSSWSKFLTFL
jgi:hypothetical protein